MLAKRVAAVATDADKASKDTGRTCVKRSYESYSRSPDSSESSSSPPPPTKRAAVEDEEEDDPFADYVAPPPSTLDSSTDVAPVKKSLPGLNAFLVPTVQQHSTSSLPAVLETVSTIQKRSKVRTSHKPATVPTKAISSFFAASSASSSPPSSAAAAVAPVLQTLVEDHFYQDRVRMSTLSTFKRQQLRARATAVSCPTCNEWIEHVTWADHAAVCRREAPMITFFSADSGARAASRRSLLVDQHAPTYDRTASWAGGELMRVTRTHFEQTSGHDRRRIVQALRWLTSVLNGHEGRDLPTSAAAASRRASAVSSDDEDEEDATAAQKGEEEDPDETLQPGQELWLYLVKSGGSHVVASGVLVNTRLDVRRVSRNTEATRVRTHTGATQRSLVDFLHSGGGGGGVTNTKEVERECDETTEPAAAAAAVAPSSSSSTDTAVTTLTSPPLFGVDKIAVHARFRFGATTAAAAAGGGRRVRTAASSSAPVSLAIHVLSSILSFSCRRGMAVVDGGVGVGESAASGSDLPFGLVAFSSPTHAGRTLAARFTRTVAFATYELERRAAAARTRTE